MVATTLALNAFALTGESRYKAWLLEYVDAWSKADYAYSAATPLHNTKTVDFLFRHYCRLPSHRGCTVLATYLLMMQSVYCLYLPADSAQTLSLPPLACFSLPLTHTKCLYYICRINLIVRFHFSDFFWVDFISNLSLVV